MPPPPGVISLPEAPNTSKDPLAIAPASSKGSATALLERCACVMGVLIATLHANGCVIYCSAYATSGCLTTEELRELGADGKTGDLLEYLRDDRSWVREEAARTLGSIRAPDAGEPSRAVLLDSNERVEVRARAAEALAELERADAMPALIGVVAAPGTAPELKIAIIGALCVLAHGAGGDSLTAIAPLVRDEDLLVSAVAEEALSRRCAPSRASLP